MKKLIIILLLLTSISFANRNHYSSYQIERILNNNGYWVKISKNTFAWKPDVNAVGWQPFTEGYWYYQSNKFIWRPKLKFEKVTSYYGNWVFTRKFGWVWFPDYKFKPLRAKIKIKNGYLLIKPLNTKYIRNHYKNKWIKYNKRIVIKKRCRKIVYR